MPRAAVSSPAEVWSRSSRCSCSHRRASDRSSAGTRGPTMPYPCTAACSAANACCHTATTGALTPIPPRPRRQALDQDDVARSREQLRVGGLAGGDAREQRCVRARTALRSNTEPAWAAVCSAARNSVRVGRAADGGRAWADRRRDRPPAQPAVSRHAPRGRRGRAPRLCGSPPLAARAESSRREATAPVRPRRPATAALPAVRVDRTGRSDPDRDACTTGKQQPPGAQ